MASTAVQDRVQVLQRTLYRAAKADPERRFHALYDKVHRRDVLERAWSNVRHNAGAAGIDRTTIADVESYGVTRLLDGLAAELKAGTYRPLPARRVFIDKPGSADKRPLSIPAVRDRIVQAAVKIVLEPVFEADFLPCSFGFRPKRGVHDALQVLIDESWRGRRWVVESDIANCFEAIPHDRLVAAVEERVCDRHVLKLLRTMLRAGVMLDGSVRGGRRRPHGADGDPAWARTGAEGVKDPDRAPGGRSRGAGLPRIPPPLGVEPVVSVPSPRELPRPLAHETGDAARPRSHPWAHDAALGTAAG
ncbi:MAG: hypothetical protein LC733_06380 [Actinobacteria bacterium]|nr:hypothetical protein [Actinomycetota bacterium]